MIAAAQRSLNLYAEKNPQGETSPTTHYLTPGLTRLGIPAEVGLVRGAYTASNNELFVCVADTIYFVGTDWTATSVGNITAGVRPVKMGDNGTTMIVVDGTAGGWSVVLASHAFAAIADVDFYGSNFVEFVDTYLVFNKPDTPIFYISDSNAITFDPLFFASKSGYPDSVQGIAIQTRNLWLIGEKTTEIWFNQGGADFPFARMDGPYMEFGTPAPYSIAKQAGSVFWLAQDMNGNSFVVEGANLKADKISTPAIETAIASYTVIADAVGMTYEQRGHAFYWLKFPSANGGLGADWVYDLSTKLWHERAWLNPQTCEEEGHRAFAHAFAYGVNVVGDRESGQLYMLDQANQTDAGGFIKRVRGFPHLMVDGNRASYPSFVADMQAGEVEATVFPADLFSTTTYPSMVTVIDTSFTATEDTLLQDYFIPFGLSEIGSQYTQITLTIDGIIVGNALSGNGIGATMYLASGVPTSANYICEFKMKPDAYDQTSVTGTLVYVIGRADASNNGYKLAVTSNGSAYSLALTVMGGATTTVVLGTLGSGYYHVYLSMIGLTIEAAVQRSEDFFWITDGAVWQSTFAKAISIMDSTYVGAGNVLIGGTWNTI